MNHGEAATLWVEFSRTGDSECFERLYRAYREDVLRYTRSRLGDEDAADDVTNRTFTYLAVARPVIHVNFESMLIYYAGLRCRSYQVSQVPKAPSGFAPYVVNGRTGPDRAAEDRDQTAETISALQRLTQDDQDLIVLHLLAGLSLRQIAELLAIPTRTLNRRYHKALSRLRRFLRDS